MPSQCQAANRGRMEGLFSGQSPEASILLLVSVAIRRYRQMTTSTRATSRAHATRFFSNLPKARHRNSARPADAMLSLREHPDTRANGVCRRLAERSAFGALVSFIAVPQSIVVPLCGTSTLLRAFYSSFLFLSKNQFRVARAATAARCHLRPSLPREPQMTTHTPSQGSITVSPVMDIVDDGLSPSVLSSSLTLPVPTGSWNDPATTLPRARPRSFQKPDRGSYLNDTPSPLPLKHLVTSEAPPNHRRQRRTFPD